MKSTTIPESEVGDLWRSMMESKLPVSLTFKEFDVNYYLKRALKAGDGPLGTKFERAFATFTPGTATVTTQHDAWGLPVYASASVKPVSADGKWTTEIVGLRIGRLGIHPSAAKLAGFALGGITKALEKEAKHFDRLERIEPGEGTLTLVTKPAQ